jgi:hypothetical protein
MNVKQTPSPYVCLFAVKPVAVHITTKDRQVSADKRYDVECRSSGSRPEAIITWWKNSRQIKRVTKNVSISIRKFCIFLEM